MIGQITPWKGQDLGIRALAGLVEQGVDAILLIVGSPTFTSGATRFDNVSYERELHELAARGGVSDRVTFLGQREDIAELLAATDALLMLSEGEPFGRVVVEAMAMGVPVVAGDDGGPRETIRDGRDGVLVPDRDPSTWASAIAGLLEQPELRARMGASGRERAAEYGIERYAEAVLGVYGAVLGARGVRTKRELGRNRRASR